MQTSVVGRMVLCLLVAGALAGCSSLQTPTARVAGVHFTDLCLQSVTVVFDVEIENPYSVDLPLANVDYSLASRESEFLSGKADIQGAVPANGKKTVAIPAHVVFLELVKAVKDIRPGSVISYKAEMGLSVRAPILGDMRLPLKKEGQLPVPTVPDLEVSEVKWEKLALDQATGHIRLKMVNRNSFAFDLSKMSYAFSLADVEVARSSIARSVAFKADGGEGAIDIPVSISAQQVGFAALRMLAGSGASYRCKGEIEVGTPFGPMLIPLDKAGNCVFKR